MSKYEEPMFKEALAKMMAERERAEVELETARVIQQLERAILDAWISRINKGKFP